MNESKNKTYLYTVFLFLALFLATCILLLLLCTRTFNIHQGTPYRAAVSLARFEAIEQKTVVLDAGHGGYDSGTKSSDGILEKDLNLAITTKIAQFLSCYDVRVVLTRSDDTAPDLVEGQSKKRGEILSRVKIANDEKADLFLSIHMNSFPQASCHGSQAFYTTKNDLNQTFANALQNACSTMIQPDNARVAKETDLIFLLSNLDCPAALFECGFLSNEEDTKLLSDESYQSKLAFCIAQAIIQTLYPSI